MTKCDSAPQPSPRLPEGGGGGVWFTADLKKPINFSIRTVCDRAAVAEEPRCGLGRLDIVDACCDDAACEDDLIGLVV